MINENADMNGNDIVDDIYQLISMPISSHTKQKSLCPIIIETGIFILNIFTCGKRNIAYWLSSIGRTLRVE